MTPEQRKHFEWVRDNMHGERMTKDEALKLALEALEEINKLSIGENAICLPAEIDTAMDAIKKTLVQPEQEPVEWYSVEGETRRYGVGMVECAYAIGRDEVVYVVTHESVKDVAMKHLPTQRTWVGLTDEEIWDTPDYEETRKMYRFAKAIEAKLKEKNT